MILFDDIIQDLIGEHAFDQTLVPVDVKTAVVGAYQKLVDSYIADTDDFEVYRDTFINAIKGSLPDVFEKAMSLRFENNANDNIFDLLNKKKDLKKGALEGRSPKFQELQQAISSLLYLNPFVFEIKEGFYETEDGQPYIYIEIPDIYQSLFEYSSLQYSTPNYKSSWFLNEDKFDPELIHRFQLPTYMMGVLCREILSSLQEANGNESGVAVKLANLFIPSLDAGYPKFQDYNGVFNYRTNIVGMEIKNMGVAEPPQSQIRKFYNSDKNTFMSFVSSSGLSGQFVMAISSKLFSDYHNMPHKQLLEMAFPNHQQTELPTVLHKYDATVIRPAMIEAVKNRFSAMRNLFPINLMQDMKVYGSLRSVLKSAQQYALLGISKTMVKIANYHGYKNIQVRVGTYVDTDLAFSLSSAGLDVLHIKRGK